MLLAINYAQNYASIIGKGLAATGDNSMYCMIPDPFPSSAFGKGSATPDYLVRGVQWSKLCFLNLIHNKSVIYILCAFDGLENTGCGEHKNHNKGHVQC